MFINSKNLRTIRKLIAYKNFQDYSWRSIWTGVFCTYYRELRTIEKWLYHEIFGQIYPWACDVRHRSEVWGRLEVEGWLKTGYKGHSFKPTFLAVALRHGWVWVPSYQGWHHAETFWFRVILHSSVVGNVTMSTGFFFSFSGVYVCFLGFLLLPTSLFSEPTEGMIAKTLLAQDHSAPVEVDGGLSGILKLAGPDCLFENTLHDTFLDFVDWVSQKQSTVIEAKKKKSGVQPLVETTKQGVHVLESSSKASMDKFGTAMRSRYAIFRKPYTRIAWCRIKRWKSQLAGRCDIERFLAILHRLILKLLWKRASSDAESRDFASVWPASNLPLWADYRFSPRQT